MNRRTFFERMAAGMAGAIAATKTLQTPQRVRLTPEEDNDPKLNPPSGAEDVIVGVAMESAGPGDVVPVLLSNFGGGRLLSTLKAEEPIEIGMFLAVTDSGMVRPATIVPRHTRG